MLRRAIRLFLTLVTHGGARVPTCNRFKVTENAEHAFPSVARRDHLFVVQSVKDAVVDATCCDLTEQHEVTGKKSMNEKRRLWPAFPPRHGGACAGAGVVHPSPHPPLTWRLEVRQTLARTTFKKNNKHNHCSTQTRESRTVEPARARCV